MLRALAAFALVFLMTSCSHQRLVVETYFIGPDSLASTRVNSPDPKRYCPTTGQELIISWRLPHEFACEKDLHILLTVRFGNRTEASVDIPLCRFRGSFTYSLLNNEYWDNGGIMSYKVELFAEDRVLECWYHQIWAEIIALEDYDEEEALLDSCHWSY